MAEISFIISTYNGLELLQRLIDSLRATWPGQLDAEVVVVDDGSTDDTVPWLQSIRDLPLRPLPLTFNQGYAVANNRAARHARGKSLLFLNNDVLLRPGWFEPMWNAHRAHPDAFAVGNLQYSTTDGQLDHAGIVFGREGHPEHFRDRDAFVRRVEVREFPAVTFACALVSRERFLGLHGFDEHYRNGCEDVDICLRTRVQGWRSLVANYSAVEHLISASPRRKDAEEVNLRRFLRLWQPLASGWHRDWEERLLREQIEARQLARSREPEPRPSSQTGDARSTDGPIRVMIDLTHQHTIEPQEAHRSSSRLLRMLAQAAGTAFQLFVVAATTTGLPELDAANENTRLCLLPGATGDASAASRTIRLTEDGDGLARWLQADVLYTPFGESRYLQPDMPAILAIHDTDAVPARRASSTRPPAGPRDSIERTARAAFALQCASAEAAQRLRQRWGIARERIVVVDSRVATEVELERAAHALLELFRSAHNAFAQGAVTWRWAEQRV